jgi:[acyl-carrier-protein] S-malonyltransferase
MGETGMEKIAFLFPGLGSHYVGMSKNLHQQYAIARETFEEASDILKMDLAKLCFEGGISELNRAENFHPALLTAEVVAYRVYMQEIGVNPEFCAGHSLGEYAALTCAGAIRFGDAVQITRELGLLTQAEIEAGDGAMTIITGIDKEAVEDECRKVTTEARPVWISCYNSPNETAISGHPEAVEQVETCVLEKGAQITPLIAGAPNHSPLMGRVAEYFSRHLAGYTFYPFKWPVIANSTAQPYGATEQIQAILIQQLLKPVRWVETLNLLNQFGVTMTVELGPQNVLSQLVAATTPDIRAFAFGQKKDRLALVNILNNHSCSDQNVGPLNSVDSKVNHKLMEEPSDSLPDLDNDFIPPRTEVERFLAAVWVELLGKPQVGSRDDFFDLGGYSLLATQMIAKIYQRYQVKLSVSTLYESPTIFSLAQAIEAAGPCMSHFNQPTGVKQPRKSTAVTGNVPLTPSHGLFLNLKNNRLDHFNIIGIFEVDSHFDTDRLQQVLLYLWEIHDALRARFIRRDGKWMQIIAEPEQSAPDFRVYNLADISTEDADRTIEKYAKLFQENINITQGPLMITAYFSFGPKRPGRLMLIINHLLVDGFSISILIKDLQTAYRQLEEGHAIDLPEKGASIKEWAELLHEYVLSDEHLKAIEYLLTLPWGESHGLPLDYPQNCDQNFNYSSAKVTVSLTKEETLILNRRIPLVLNTGVDNVLLWALSKVIFEWTGSKLVEIVMVDNGRNMIPVQKCLDLSRTVGFLATRQTLLLKNYESADWLREVALFCEQIKRIPNNGCDYFLAASLTKNNQVIKKLSKIRSIEKFLGYSEIQLNYRGSILDNNESSALKLLQSYDVSFDPQSDRLRNLNIYCDIFNHCLNIVWEYSYNLYKRETIERLADKYIHIIKDLIHKLAD